MCMLELLIGGWLSRNWNNSVKFAVRQLGVQICKYVQHLLREVTYSAPLIYHLMFECIFSCLFFFSTILHVTK